MGDVLGFPSIDPDDVRVGARLHRWRTERAVDLDVLADAMDSTPEHVRLIEAGRRRLTSAQLAAATTCLHLPLWALVSDTPAY
ncbi:hypothetical protein BH10PSE2_BH10PSE2_28390 [soil metagenome]